MGGKKRRGGGAGAAAAGGGTNDAAAIAEQGQAASSSRYTPYTRTKPASAAMYQSSTATREVSSSFAAPAAAPQEASGWGAAEDPPATVWDDSTPEAKLFNVASPRRELTQAWISQHSPNAPQGPAGWEPPPDSYSFGNGNGNGHEAAEDSNGGSFDDSARLEIPSSSPEPEASQHRTPTVVHEPAKGAGEEEPAAAETDTAQPEEHEEEIIMPKDMRDVTTLFIAA